PEGLDPYVKQPPLPKLSNLFTMSTKAYADLATAQAQKEPPLPPNQFPWHKMAKHGIDPDMIRRAQNRVRHPNAVGAEYVNPHALNVALIQPRLILDDILMETPKNLKAWREVQKKLILMNNFCRRPEASLVIVMIPSTIQVDRSHTSFYERIKFQLDERL